MSVRLSINSDNYVYGISLQTACHGKEERLCESTNYRLSQKRLHVCGLWSKMYVADIKS